MMQELRPTGFEHPTTMNSMIERTSLKEKKIEQNVEC